MDHNFKFWKCEGTTFPQRFHHWLDILNPLLLIKTKKDIEISRSLLLISGPDITKSLQNKEIKEAWNLNLASVNPASGDILFSLFRPPAFLPLTAPLVLFTGHWYFITTQRIEASISVAGTEPIHFVSTFFYFLLGNSTYMLLCFQSPIFQLFFHIYTSGFSLAHGNPTQDPEEFPYKRTLLNTGAILYFASLGAFPTYLMTRFQWRSPSVQSFMKVIPGLLTAALCGFNVLVIRASEFEKGIEIMDSKGKIVGVSPKAGKKAVTETAVSRAVMIGTTLCVPDIVLHYLKRTNISVKNPRSWGALRSTLIVFILGLMIPASFSWIPQYGMIQRSLIEPDIISSTEETEFIYYRGL